MDTVSEIKEPIKNLASFKRRLKVGIKLRTKHLIHGDVGVREVSIVQSNCFALRTTKLDGCVTDSWCDFPKAKDFEVLNDNSVRIKNMLEYSFV